MKSEKISFKYHLTYPYKKSSTDFCDPSKLFVKGVFCGVVGWYEGVVFLTSLGRETDIGLQLGKACYPCSWKG